MTRPGTRARAAGRLWPLALVLAGCGYFLGGQWDDDPRNWERAFGSSKPSGVEVVHSRYTRYPHWSFEYACYFAVRPSAEVERQLLQGAGHVTGPDARSAKDLWIPHDAPAWFAPGGPDRYDIFNLPSSGWVALKDRQTGVLFLHGSQL